METVRKKKMCKYCDNFEKKKLQINDTFIVSPAKYTFVGDGKEYNVPLFFCPACGRKLK